jgi:hypothetical protein
MILVMLMASGANSTPEQIRTLKLWMLLFVVGGIVCLSLGALLVWKAHPITGGLIGCLPMGVVFGGVVWFSIPQ